MNMDQLYLSSYVLSFWPLALLVVLFVGSVFYSKSKRLNRKFDKIKDQLYLIPGFSLYEEGSVDEGKLAETEFEYDEYHERKKGKAGVIKRGPVTIFLVYTLVKTPADKSERFVTYLYAKKQIPFNKLEVSQRPPIMKLMFPSTVPIVGNEDNALGIVYHHKTGDDMDAIKRHVEKILPFGVLQKVKMFPWSTMVFDKKRIRITINGFYKDIDGLMNMIDVLEGLVKADY